MQQESLAAACTQGIEAGADETKVVWKNASRA